MDVHDLLTEEFGRLLDLVHWAADDLDADQLVAAPAPGANTIAWLVWHLTRVQDHHVSELLGEPQLYIADGWYERFGRGPDPEDHGYGHTPEEVASVRPAAARDLVGYYDVVHARTLAYLSGVRAGDLDQVVDDRWDPPVTLAVRLTSILTDDLQHAGQAAYVRGLLTS